MRNYSEEEIREAEEEDEIIHVWCPPCLEAGYQVQLGFKILMPGEQRPPDYENWLECSKCGFICPVHELPKEETVQDAVETIESPFEQGRFIIESIPKRNSAVGKRKRKNKIKLHEDPEIDTLMRIYGKRVRILYDSN